MLILLYIHDKIQQMFLLKSLTTLRNDRQYFRAVDRLKNYRHISVLITDQQ